MTDQIDEPAPTIVGPQPSAGGSGRMMDIPRGLERLLTLAGLSAEWREKVLLDPVGAAGEAEVELSASERAIIAAIPAAALAGMIDGFARSQGLGASAGKLAAGAAAAAAVALLVTGSAAYGGESPSAKGGARADVPPIKPDKVGMPAPTGSRPDVPGEAPKVLWMTDLDAALAQAKKTKRAVMAVFLPVPKPVRPRPVGITRGIKHDVPKLTVEERSRKVVLTDSKEFRKAVRNASVLGVRVAGPQSPFNMAVARKLTPKEEEQVKAYHKRRAAYEKALKKYGIGKKLPAVVFLAPDGSALSKSVQPATEKKLVAAIKAVPPLLAAWITAQRMHKRIPAAGGGIRADAPRSIGGVRADTPGK